MREILFRGKRVDNGEWVYSSFIMQDKEHKVLSTEAELFDGEKWRAVIPETVGEYTGLTDKNGKKIFEGDTVKLYDTWGTWRAAVEFGNPNGNYTWGWQLKPIGKVDINTDILCWVEMEESGAYCEVIGNIHDNPELMEV